MFFSRPSSYHFCFGIKHCRANFVLQGSHQIPLKRSHAPTKISKIFKDAFKPKRKIGPASLKRCVSDFCSLSWEFPNLVVLNLVVCNFYADALFCALWRSFAPFCALCAHLRSFAFALFCAHLRSFARLCVFLQTTAFGKCRS